MNKVDFLLSYEHKAREGEAVLLIKQLLERLGYVVDTYSSYEAYTKNRVKAKVVLVPAAYNTGVLNCFCFEKAGLCSKIANLQWEQLLSEEEEADLHAYHNPTELAKDVYHFTWGQRTKDRLIAAGISPDRCVLTGGIHIDYLRKEFSNTLMSKQKLAEVANLDANKPWTLMISSFTLANIDPVVIEQLKEVYSDSISCKLEWFKKSRNEVLLWIEYYVRQFPDKILIYRPHPDEINIGTDLFELEKKYSNFRVISMYSVKQWINQSDCCFNWYSTSAADVYYLNKPCLILRPFAVPEGQEVVIMKKGNFITSFDSFKKAVALEPGLWENPLNDSLFHEYYCNDFSDEPAFMKVVRQLLLMYHAPKGNMHYNLSFRLKWCLRKTKRMLKPVVFLCRFMPFIDKKLKHYELNIANTKSLLEKGFERNVISKREMEDSERQLAFIIDAYSKQLVEFKKLTKSKVLD